MSDPTNPYKPNDKVFITVKGAEVEATVRLVWNDEVQVRVPSSGLLWRTVRTVRATPAALVETAARAAPQPEPTPLAPQVSAGNASEAVAPHSEEATAANGPSVETEPKAVDTGAIESEEPAQPSTGTAEFLSCGVPEVEADRKRSKKNKRRR